MENKQLRKLTLGMEITLSMQFNNCFEAVDI